MKILLFSDLHCDTDKARRLVEMSRDAELVIGAGDLANMRRGLERSINVLQAIDKPTVLVPGNSESHGELRDACSKWKSAHVLHGSGVTILGIDFYGIGGGIPVTPFGSWSFDFTEEQAAELLADCPERCVLITHSPPKGAVDLSSRGVSLGSVTVRRAVEERRPQLVVCGHIHESSGKQEEIGTTPVINAGPDGLLWDLAVAP